MVVGKRCKVFLFLAHRPRSRAPRPLRLRDRRFSKRKGKTSVYRLILRRIFRWRHRFQVVSSQRERILNNSCLQLSPILLSTGLLYTLSQCNAPLPQFAWLRPEHVTKVDLSYLPKCSECLFINLAKELVSNFRLKRFLYGGGLTCLKNQSFSRGIKKLNYVKNVFLPKTWVIVDQ